MSAHRLPAMFIEVEIGGVVAFRAPVKSYAHGLRVTMKAGDGRVLSTVAKFEGILTTEGPELGIWVGGDRVDNLHNVGIPGGKR